MGPAADVNAPRAKPSQAEIMPEKTAIYSEFQSVTAFIATAVSV
jgi:hypothetical protein